MTNFNDVSLLNGSFTEVLAEYSKNIPSKYIKEALAKDLSELFSFLNCSELSLLTPEMMTRYRDHITALFAPEAPEPGNESIDFNPREKEERPREVRNKFGNVGRFFAYLAKKGHIKVNPAHVLLDPNRIVKKKSNSNGNSPHVSPQNKKNFELTEETKLLILDSIDDTTLAGASQKAIMTLMVNLPLRPMDFVNLRRNQIERSGRYNNLVIPSKEGMPRKLPLHFPVKKAIETYFHLCSAEGIFINQDDFIFSAIENNSHNGNGNSNYGNRKISHDSGLRKKLDLYSLEQMINRCLKRAQINHQVVLSPWKTVFNFKKSPRPFEAEHSQHGRRPQFNRRPSYGE